MVLIVRQNFYKNAILFKNKAKQLRNVLNTNIPITHVGSTAIPKMSGKNIIDILVGATNEIEFNEIANKITELDYFSSKNSKQKEYLFFASKEEETKSGDVHIHLALLGTDRYNNFISLKEYLLRNPKKAKTYSDNKMKLAKLAEKDRSEYKRLKSEEVSELIRMAKGE